MNNGIFYELPRTRGKGKTSREISPGIFDHYRMPQSERGKRNPVGSL